MLWKRREVRKFFIILVSRQVAKILWDFFVNNCVKEVVDEEWKAIRVNSSTEQLTCWLRYFVTSEGRELKSKKLCSPLPLFWSLWAGKRSLDHWGICLLKSPWCMTCCNSDSHKGLMWRHCLSFQRSSNFFFFFFWKGQCFEVYTWPVWNLFSVCEIEGAGEKETVLPIILSILFLFCLASWSIGKQQLNLICVCEAKETVSSCILDTLFFCPSWYPFFDLVTASSASEKSCNNSYNCKNSCNYCKNLVTIAVTKIKGREKGKLKALASSTFNVWLIWRALLVLVPCYSVLSNYLSWAELTTNICFKESNVQMCNFQVFLCSRLAAYFSCIPL